MPTKVRSVRPRPETIQKAELCIMVARLELGLEEQTLEDRALKLMRHTEAELMAKLRKYRRKKR